MSEVLKAYARQLKELKGVKFAYAILKNTDSLAKEAKAIMSTRVIEDAFKTYDAERVAICEKFSEKDERGVPKKKETQYNQFEYVIDPTNEDFKKEISDLKVKYAETIAAQEANDKAFNAFLVEENEAFVLYKLKIDDFPENISLEILSALQMMILE